MILNYLPLVYKDESKNKIRSTLVSPLMKAKKQEDYREEFNKLYDKFKDQLVVGDLEL